MFHLAVQKKKRKMLTLKATLVIFSRIQQWLFTLSSAVFVILNDVATDKYHNNVILTKPLNLRVDVVLCGQMVSNMFEPEQMFLQFLTKCFSPFKFYQTRSNTIQRDPTRSNMVSRRENVWSKNSV